MTHARVETGGGYGRKPGRKVPRLSPIEFVIPSSFDIRASSFYRHSARDSHNPEGDDGYYNCPWPRALDGVRHVLGDSVAAHSRLRLVCCCASGCFQARDDKIAAERFPEVACDRVRTRRGVVLLFLRGGGIGTFYLPQRRR